MEGRVEGRVCVWCKKLFQPKNKRGVFCSRSCAGKHRQQIHHKPIEQRLWTRLKIADNGCWEWQGRKDKDGYGALDYRFNGRREQRAHRVAWIVVFGEIPDGQWALHKCDNRPCCNPMHLFLGDAASNNADMIQKGRQYYPAGELAGNAILTERQVIEIRALHASGVTQRLIAKQFGVGFKAINKIVLRQRWKHI